MVKRELLSIVNTHKHRFRFRLPPYHCELNPIELVWAHVKGNVARKNTTYKMSDVQKLFEEALQEVNAGKWQRCIEHVIKEEEKMWQLDSLLEKTAEPLIINLGEEDSPSDISFSDDD